MNSVITEITVSKDYNGIILFDGNCPICRHAITRFGAFLARHGFASAALQTPWVRQRLENDPKPLLAEMRLLTPANEVLGGADALLAIAAKLWWARPLRWVSSLPGVMPVFRKAYAWIARNRYCFGGQCKLEKANLNHPLLKFAPFFGLPVLAAILGWNLPGWISMSVIAVALFAGAKWVTLFRFLTQPKQPNPWRVLAYTFFWPGMDSGSFFGSKPVPKPLVREWAGAFLKTFFGAALIWILMPMIHRPQPLVQGWIGMVGLVLLLHCGAFHLLSLSYRKAGINAQPIMNAPASAASLAKFWGGRWNRAFSDLMQEHFLTPLRRRFGGAGAVLIIFLISGLSHEAVISIPAHGGYGLPTLFFALQGAAILFERSPIGRAFGLGRGLRGWVFVFLMTALPAFWLFHPAFVRNVIHPMFQAMGAT